MPKSNRIKAGAIWVKTKTNDKGEDYKVISVAIDVPVTAFKENSEVVENSYDEQRHVKIFLSGFVNGYKETPEQPDYQLFLYPKKEKEDL